MKSMLLHNEWGKHIIKCLPVTCVASRIVIVSRVLPKGVATLPLQVPLVYLVNETKWNDLSNIVV